MMLGKHSKPLVFQTDAFLWGVGFFMDFKIEPARANLRCMLFRIAWKQPLDFRYPPRLG